MSDNTSRFVAGALVAVGAIMIAIAGPCTAFFGAELSSSSCAAATPASRASSW